MLFNLEHDNGDVIEGYLVPDGYSEQPWIIVMDDQARLVELPCNSMREAVIRSGRHETGMVGFRLDETIVKGLKGRTKLAIYDGKTGILVYRRTAPARTIKKKFVRLETRIVPSIDIDLFMERRFQYGISRVERYGLETAQQVFHLHGISSIYVSGRLQIRSFTEFLDKDFEAMTIVNDPYTEMAERIYLCTAFATLPPDLFGERDQMLMKPVVAHFADVDLMSLSSLKKSLRAMDGAVRRYLESPLTRQLATVNPEDSINRHSVTTALDFLSRFIVIGLRPEPRTFTNAIGELVGASPEEVPAPPVHAKISALAARLRDVPVAERIIENDLILYHFVSDAVVTSYTHNETERLGAPGPGTAH